MRLSMKFIPYLALTLLSVTTIVTGHANHDGHDHDHDHGVDLAQGHFARAEHPAIPEDTDGVSRVKRGLLFKRSDLFTSCTAAFTACKQHVQQVYRNTPDLGAETRNCETAYYTCLKAAVTNREAYPVYGQTSLVCPVCQEQFQSTSVVFTSRCSTNHVYHADCLQQYIARGYKKCMLCNDKNLK